MEIFQTVTTRRCIRKFRSDSVPQVLIREILEAARWSPSWGNTQPWEVVVATGAPLERFREANRKRFLEGATSAPDVPMPEVWPELFKRRYMDVGKMVLTALSIPREDREGRLRYGGDMAALFGAPCLLLLCIDKGLAREYAMLDIGAIQQTICLLAHARGLGSCILAASVRYPDLIREMIPIREGAAVIMGVALGYADSEAPINKFARERATLDEFTTWISS